MRLGAYIFNETSSPRKAFYFLEKAVEYSMPDDPLISNMIEQLIEAGRKDWADRLISIRNKIALL